MSGLLVQKYGGTSVGTPERIRAVADRIGRTHRAGTPLVVVVSAMGDTTDELIELAFRVSAQPHHREMDMLLTAGERISMALLSMALWDRNVPAVSFTGSQTGIITNSSHRRARIQRILGDRVREAIHRGKVAIVAGFQGVSESKEITTLGRGGSDTSAVALAAALKAQACEIYTDVDGVFSADPRVVRDAHLLRQISHDQMVELATRGAGVLHPRSVELAKQYGVKLFVKNSLRESKDSQESDDPGTEIVQMSEIRDTFGPNKGMEDFQVTGITADPSKMLVEIEMERATAASAVWHTAAENSLNVVSPFFLENSLRFFSDADSEEEWKKHLTYLSIQGFVRKYKLDTEIVPLSVVGDRFSQDGAALQQVVEILAENHISVTMGSASALGITVAVAKTHMDDGVRALHQSFFRKGE